MDEDVQTSENPPVAGKDLEKASIDTVYEKLSTSAKGLTAAALKAGSMFQMFNPRTC